MEISVIGLGKVGLTLAACLASAGNRVIGADSSAPLVELISSGQFKSPEPGVTDRLQKLDDSRFWATTDAQTAIKKTDITFVIVPTPSNTLGGFSLRYVLTACDLIGEALLQKKSDHIVSMVSTVLPGSSDLKIIPRLEEKSGRKIGKGLGYCYNPSFIALGEVVKGIEHPDFILIGESDPATGEQVLAAHRSMTPAGTPVARMQTIEAEITKLASNTHETMRVSFANMLMSVCSEIPNTNVDRVTDALTHRMGKRFFRGATPFGGPCWPRDNEALAVFMDALRVPSRMPRNVDIFNREHSRFILGKILEASAPAMRVGLIGMAYKPGTSVIDRSFGIELAEWLTNEQRQVVAWDPLAMNESKVQLNDKVEFASSLSDCVKQADLVVILLPLTELQSFDWSQAKQKTVIDCWRCLAEPQRKLVEKYLPLGSGPLQDRRQWLESTLGKQLELLTT